MTINAKTAARLIVQHQALITQLKAAGGDEIATLRGVVSFLFRTGVPQELVVPIIRTLGQMLDEDVKAGRGELSGTPRPIAETLAYVTCAATVTMLKQRHGRKMQIADAVKRVADRSGLDRKKLKTFRENLLRGLHKPFATSAYRDYLTDIRDISDEESLSRINGLCDMLALPAKANT